MSTSSTPDKTTTEWPLPLIPASIVGLLAAAVACCMALIAKASPEEAMLIAALAGALSLASAIAPWWTARAIFQRMQRFAARDL